MNWILSCQNFKQLCPLQGELPRFVPAELRAESASDVLALYFFLIPFWSQLQSFNICKWQIWRVGVPYLISPKLVGVSMREDTDYSFLLDSIVKSSATYMVG